MPIFEYRCAQCGTAFERLVLQQSTATLIACPQCGSTETSKLFSTFSAHGMTTNNTACSPGASTFR